MKTTEQILIAFFSNIYDEWVTHPWSAEAPRIDACTYRSLRQAFESEFFDVFIARIANERKVKRLKDFLHADAKEPVLEIIDYIR